MSRTLNLAKLAHACAELRDDARELAAGDAITEAHGSAIAGDWMNLAADLAALTSKTLGEYVEQLDPETKRIVELSAERIGGGQ